MDGKLVEAARMGDVELLHKLVEDDPLMLHSVALQGGETPLHIACKAGHLNFVQEILRLKQGFAKDLNHEGFSPLHFASANGYLDIVKELLRVDPSLCLVRGRMGKIPLHSAAIKGRIDVIKELLAARPDSVEELTARKETALHLAVKYNQFEALRFIAEHLKGSPQKSTILNKKDQQGNTILHLAVSMKQYEVVEFLVGENSDPDAKVEVDCFNKSGLTAIDVILAVQSEAADGEIVEILRQARALRARDLQAATVEAVASFPQNQEVTTEAEVWLSESYQEATVEVKESFPQNQEATVEAEVSLSQNQEGMVEAEVLTTSFARNQETAVEAEATVDAEASFTQNLQDVVTEMHNEDAISEETSAQNQESSSYKQSEAAQERKLFLSKGLTAIGSSIWYNDVQKLPSEVRDMLLLIALNYIVIQSNFWPLEDILEDGYYEQHDGRVILQHLKNIHFYGAFFFVSTVFFFFLSQLSDIVILKYRIILNRELIISFTDFVLTYGTFTIAFMPKPCINNHGFTRALWAVPVIHILVFKLKDRTNETSQGNAPKFASQENIREADENSSGPSSSQNKDDIAEASFPQNPDVTEMVSASKNKQSDSERAQKHDPSLVKQLVRYLRWCDNTMYPAKEMTSYFLIPTIIGLSHCPDILRHYIEQQQAGAMLWGLKDILYCGIFVFESASYFFFFSCAIDALVFIYGFSLNEDLIISTTERVLTYGTSIAAIMPQGIINNYVVSPALLLVAGMHLLALKSKRSRMRLGSAPKGAEWGSFDATGHNGAPLSTDNQEVKMTISSTDEQSKVVQRHDLSLKQLLKRCFSWHHIVRHFPCQGINTCLLMAVTISTLLFARMGHTRKPLSHHDVQMMKLIVTLGGGNERRDQVILILMTMIYIPILHFGLRRMSFQKGLICVCVFIGLVLVALFFHRIVTFSVLRISVINSIYSVIMSGIVMTWGKRLLAIRNRTRQCRARGGASLDSIEVDSTDRSSGVPAP
ncbi:hypothetical protein NMG60_11023163 [Bertholletia excelsa]